MTITITIEADNAAFDDSGEVARILRELAERIDGEADRELSNPIFLRDYNGNKVGALRVTD